MNRKRMIDSKMKYLTHSALSNKLNELSTTKVEILFQQQQATHTQNSFANP